MMPQPSPWSQLVDMILTLEEALVATEGWIQQTGHDEAMRAKAMKVCNQRAMALDKLDDLRERLQF